MYRKMSPIGYLFAVHCSLIAQNITWGPYHFFMMDSVSTDNVEDQGTTGTCWSFSTTSYIQSECKRLNKPIPNLSDMFFVRMNYLEKAELFLRFQGKNTFDEGSLAHDVLRLLYRYGAMPEIAYSGLIHPSGHHNHLALKKELKKYLEDILARQAIPGSWKDEFNLIMDRHLGPLPKEFTYEGKVYTATSFAKELIPFDPSNYLSLTSFSHHPSYSCFVLEIPDNYSRSYYINVPLNDMKSVARHALKLGHTLVWDCDVSEKGFVTGQGLAYIHSDDKTHQSSIADILSKEPEVTSQMRQERFDHFDLTDDHLMHIVGWAKDNFEKVFYYVKNSWGIHAGREGHLMASENYFEMNTIAITIHRDALPEDLKKRISGLNCLHNQ